MEMGKLEREFAKAREILIKCLSIMPVGYVPTHTLENLPEMIGDLAKALAEETTEREQLERELAEAKFDLQFRRDLYALQSKELAKAREQRDELVEALEMVATHTYVDGQCDNGYSPQYVAKQALAAVKGGSND
jgi:predicted RNase H-like nuclease (RuvC/YqgF family)